MAHPQLFFTESDLPALKTRAQRTHFKKNGKQIDSLLNEARLYLNTDFTSTSVFVDEKATMARVLAMVTLVLDPSHPEYSSFARKAKEALKNINTGTMWITTPEWGGTTGTWKWDGSTNFNPWMAGGVLTYYSQAYDWFVGASEAGFVPPADQLTAQESAHARHRLLMLAAMVHDRAKRTYSNFIPGQTLVAVNMRLRVMAGLGHVALTFPDFSGTIPDNENLTGGHPFSITTNELLDWVINDLFVFDHSMDEFDNANQGTVANCVTPEGLYNEGASYQDDSMSVLTPFLFAYYKRTGKNYFTGADGFDDRLAKMHAWNIKSMMPDKTNPTLNTGWQGGSSWGHAVVAPLIPNSDWHYWYFLEAEGGVMGVTEHIAYLPTIPSSPAQPNFRTEFLPETGLAVFRDKWGPDATYMLLAAEGIPTRGHRQGDQTSFVIYSRGAYMAVDPGDGRNYGHTKHNWILSAYAHNLITVDAKHTPTQPIGLNEIDEMSPYKNPRFTILEDKAQLRNSFAKKNMDYTEASMTYSIPGDVSIVRKVAFVRHTYFVIADDLTAQKSHAYRWQLHVGTGTSRGTLSNIGNRYTWRMEGAQKRMAALDINFLKGASSVGVHTDAPTNWTSGETIDHTLLIGHAQAADHQYLAALVPRWDSENPVAAVELVPKTAWKIIHDNGEYDIVIHKNESGIVKVDRIETDAKFLIASFGTNAGKVRLQNVFARNASVLTVSTSRKESFSPNGAETFYLESTEDGTPDTPPITAEELEPVRFQIFENVVSPSQQKNVRIHYEINGAGPLQISIHERTGKLVKTLISESVNGAFGDLIWDGRNTDGDLVASGTYLLRYAFNSNVHTEKIVVVK